MEDARAKKGTTMISETRMIGHFAQLENPRDERNRKQPLTNVIAIAMVGVLSGADTWVDIERYGKSKRDWVETFLDLPNGIAAHDTLGRVDPAGVGRHAGARKCGGRKMAHTSGTGYGW